MQILKQFLQQLTNTPPSFPYNSTNKLLSQQLSEKMWCLLYPVHQDGSASMLCRHQCPSPATHIHVGTSKPTQVGGSSSVGTYRLQKGVGEAARLGEGFSSLSSKHCPWQHKTNLVCVTSSKLPNVYSHQRAAPASMLHHVCKRRMEEKQIPFCPYKVS